MKVICIENDLEELPDAPNEKVCVGKVYTVKEVVNGYGAEWYVLENMNTDWGWNPKCFMPLSDKDESMFDRMLKVCLNTKPMRKKMPIEPNVQVSDATKPL